MKEIKVIIDICDCACPHCDQDGSFTEITCPYCDYPFYANGNFDFEKEGKEKVKCPECNKKFMLNKTIEYI